MPTIASWDAPPRQAALAANELHIWCADLDDAAPFAAHLSPDEQQRAARFHFERDRLRYSAGRAILRSILARYAGCEAQALTFRYGDAGKPSLPNSALSFNLAHSQRLALYAVTLGHEVGIDIEEMRELPDLAQIAAHFFSPQEQALVSAAPPAEKTRVFFSLWTCKEAFLKAHGGGLSWGLDKVTFTLDPPAFASINGDTAEARQWSLHQFAPAPGYLAALALRAPLPMLRYYRYQYR